MTKSQLCISRKVDEGAIIHVADGITVTITAIQGNRVTIAFQADSSIKINRVGGKNEDPIFRPNNKQLWVANKPVTPKRKPTKPTL